jgi:hypothetical protein
MRRLLAVAGVILVILLVWKLWPKRAPIVHAPPAPPPSAPPPHLPWVLQPPPSVARVEGTRKPDQSRYGLWMLSNPKLPVIVADSLIVSRFPRDSLPLTKYKVDQLQPNRRFDSPGPVTYDDLTVEPHKTVLFTGDKFRLVGGDTLLMTIALFDDGRPVPIKVVTATARAIAVDGSAVGLEMPVTFNDRDDLVKMATLQLSGTPIEKHAGKVNVDVQYDPGNGKLAQATLDCVYQPGGPPPARFTGQFREALENGSLDIYAGVEVTEPGSYMIAANLYDARGEPAVSMLARMVPLDASTTEVKLQAFGRVIREANAPSPFTMSNLRGYIFYAGKEPDRATMPDYTDDYHTQKYPLEAFSDDEYWDSHKQQQIDSLLAAAQQAPPGSQFALTIGDATQQGWQPQW